MVFGSMSDVGDIASSPFIVPVAGCIMIAVIASSGIFSSAKKREIESQERLAAIARGMAPPPTLEELEITRERPVSNAQRRYANIRLAGIVLVSSGLGVVLFFIALTAILQVRNVLCGAAAGLIPLGIGVGMLIDAARQKQEMASADRATAPGPLA